MDIIFIAQKVIHLNACKTDITRIDRQLSDIKIIDAATVFQLAAIGIIAADRIYLLACVFCHLLHLAKGAFSAHVQVTARNIQARKQKVGGTRCLRQVDYLADVLPVDSRPGQKQAALRQAAARLVHRNGGHIRTCRHSVDRHILAKIKMRAVCFIHQAEHVVLMRQLDDRAQVRADTIIRRIVDQNGSGIWVRLNCLFHLADFHAQGNSQPAVHLRIDVNRYRTV